MERISFEIGKVRVPTIFVPVAINRKFPHSVLKIELNGGSETWIVDTTGSQFGFRVVLVPFYKYYTDHECRILGGTPGCTCCETTDLDFLKTDPNTKKTNASRHDLEIERRYRLHFAAFYDKRDWDDTLVGSDAVFKEKIDRFVNELKSHMFDL